jgi:DNA-nicking Smr family endonuclease
LKRKISDKDKKDWKNFISNKEKLSNKDLYLSNNKIEKEIIKTIDLHGFSLENANNVIEEFIIQCFKKNVNKIIVITGKGLRSKSIRNPYVSKDLSILKYSVPDFIKLKPNLMKIIKKIEEAKIEDGGGGAFYIYLKKF